MNDQHYADARDVSKWSLLSRLSRDRDIKRVIQVAMRTVDHRDEGNIWDRPRDAEPHVQSFFESERRALPDPGLREPNCLERVVALGRALPGSLEIQVFADVFSNRGRRSYFVRTAERLQSYSRPPVVLLDPDTGIGGRHRKYVMSEEVALVYRAVPNGSTLVVFQFNTRQADWVNGKMELLRSGLPTAAQVDVHRADQVAFYIVRKEG